VKATSAKIAAWRGRASMMVYSRSHVTPTPRSRRHELITDRQAPDALARRGEDRVTQRGCDRRHAGFADASERHRPIVRRHQVHADVAWGLGDARDGIGVEVVLFHA